MTEPENSGGGSNSAPTEEELKEALSLSPVLDLLPRRRQKDEPIQDVEILEKENTLHFISSIHGPLPKSFSMLKNLKSLYIYRHKLSEFPKEILELIELVHLSIYNGLLSNIPEGITKLKKLTSLRLNNNKLTDVKPILKMKLLKRLYLHGNKIALKKEDIIEHLDFLEELQMDQMQKEYNEDDIKVLRRKPPDGQVSFQLNPEVQLTNVESDEGPSHVEMKPTTDETNLEQIAKKITFKYRKNLRSEIQDCKLGENQIYAFFQERPDLLKVVELDMSNNQITGIPEFVTTLSHLVELDMSHNQIIEIPESIAALSNLVKLDMSYNQIIEIPASIAALSNLVKLDMSYNQIIEIPASIAALSNLVHLDLSNNKIKGLMAGLSTLRALKYISLAQNKIMNVPVWLADLPNISNIDLSSNKITLIDEKIVRGNATWNFMNNPGMIVDMKLSLQPSLELDVTEVKLHLDYRVLMAEEIHRYRNDGVKTITLGNENLKFEPESNLEEKWSTMCTDRGLKTDGDEALETYPMNLPPHYCQDEKFVVKTIGQPGPLFNSYIQILGTNELGIIKVFEVLKLLRLHSKDTFMLLAYENYAVKLLKIMIKEKKDYQIDWRILIAKATEANASIFFGHSDVQKGLEKAWLFNPNHKECVPLDPDTTDSYYEASTLCTTFQCCATRKESLLSRMKKMNFFAKPKNNFISNLIMYIFYMGVLIAYIIGMNESYRGKNYYFADELRSRFNIDFVQKPNDFWPFLENQIVPNLNTDPKYYSDLARQDQESVLDGYSRLVGNIRLRQYRSHIEDCSNLEPKAIKDENENMNNKCVRPYGDQYRAVSPYGKDKQFRVTGRTKLEVGNSNARIQYYEGPAFVEFLPSNQTLRNQTLALLKEDYWVDFQTRAVFVDFILANDHLDIIGSFSISFEFLVTGQCIPKFLADSMPNSIYNNFWSPSDSLALLIGIYSLGYLAQAVEEIFTRRKYYGIIILDISTFVLTMILFIIHFHLKDIGPDAQAESEEALTATFLKFQEVSLAWSVLKMSCFFLTISSFCRVMYFLCLIEYFGLIIVAIYRMLRNTLNYLAVLAIFTFTYSLGGYAAYGSSVKEFSSFMESVYFFTNVLFGDFNFNTLNEVEPITGTIVIVSFILLCNITLLNLLIAILNNTYENVTLQSASLRGELKALLINQAYAGHFPIPCNTISELFDLFCYLRKFTQFLLSKLDEGNIPNHVCAENESQNRDLKGESVGDRSPLIPKMGKSPTYSAMSLLPQTQAQND